MPVEAIKEWWTKEKKKWTEAPPEPVDPSVTIPESEMISVTLQELSSVWVGYNKTFKSVKTPSVAVPVVSDDDLKESPESPVNPGPASVVVAEQPSLPDELTGGVQPLPLGKNSGWCNETTEFIRDVVKPYEQGCDLINALDGIYQILDLLDKQGGCPSIVNVGKDDADVDLKTMKGILLQVTLRQHTYRVAILAVSRILEDYRDPGPVIPPMIVAALGHDLGKLPTLRVGDTYSKYNHPPISEEKVRAIFTGNNLPWLGRVLKAIKGHHTRADENNRADQFAADLQYADGKAREEEIARVTGKMTKKWDEWFDPKEFLERIKPYINAPQIGNQWKAFSHGGIVYFEATFLQECAKEYAESKNVVDLSVVRNKDLEYALRKIVKSLREIGVVSDDLANKEYYGRNYIIALKQGRSVPKFLVPLNIDAFGPPSELEKNKDGSCYVIASVRPKE